MRASDNVYYVKLVAGPTLSLILALMASAIIGGCAHSSVRWTSGGGPPSVPVSASIAVLVLPGPALPPDSAAFDEQLLQIVREDRPAAELVHGNENAASRLALQRGADFLLIATILRWRDAQTQYSGEPDRIGIAVRLMRLRPSGVIGEFRFDARSFPLAIRDAPADRLLNDKFREAVRRLLATSRP